MKYKVLKQVTKDYDEIYTPERNTSEIHIETDGVYIKITEQQVGEQLKEPVIYISKGYISVGFGMSEFLKRIGINIKEDREE